MNSPVVQPASPIVHRTLSRHESIGRDVLPECCQHVGPPPGFLPLPQWHMTYLFRERSFMCNVCHREVSKEHLLYMMITDPGSEFQRRNFCPRHGVKTMVIRFRPQDPGALLLSSIPTPDEYLIGWHCTTEPDNREESPDIIECTGLLDTQIILDTQIDISDDEVREEVYGADPWRWMDRDAVRYELDSEEPALMEDIDAIIERNIAIDIEHDEIRSDIDDIVQSHESDPLPF